MYDILCFKICEFLAFCFQLLSAPPSIRKFVLLVIRTTPQFLLYIVSHPGNGKNHFVRQEDNGEHFFLILIANLLLCFFRLFLIDLFFSWL